MFLQRAAQLGGTHALLPGPRGKLFPSGKLAFEKLRDLLVAAVALLHLGGVHPGALKAILQLLVLPLELLYLGQELRVLLALLEAQRRLFSRSAALGWLARACSTGTACRAAR